MADITGINMKYIVLKCDDIETFPRQTIVNLSNILKEVGEYRVAMGKLRTNHYLVINTDEPYAQEIIDIMKKNGHWG